MTYHHARSRDVEGGGGRQVSLSLSHAAGSIIRFSTDGVEWVVFVPVFSAKIKCSTNGRTGNAMVVVSCPLPTEKYPIYFFFLWGRSLIFFWLNFTLKHDTPVKFHHKRWLKKKNIKFSSNSKFILLWIIIIIIPTIPYINHIFSIVNNFKNHQSLYDRED